MTTLKRCYHVTITAGGDTWEAALAQLSELFHVAEKHGPDAHSIVGGYDRGGSIMVEHDPDMTGEKYRAELERVADALDEIPTYTCPQCGPGSHTDEDGCCTTCGADLPELVGPTN